MNREPSADRLARSLLVVLLIVIGLSCFGARYAEAQPVEWNQRMVSGPAGRGNPAMVWDAVRGECVLFGGYIGSPAVTNNETWVWNGTTWNQRLVSGPSGRATSMTYDSMRGKAVLFGGDILTPAAGPISGETWEWNGSSWTLRASSGPSPRFYHGMAYDKARGETVLFGGVVDRASHCNNETWAWNGSVWTLRATTGPAPRATNGTGMVFDEARGEIVLFGGADDSNQKLYGDTWIWNGVSWFQRTVVGPNPSPRVGHTMVYDVSRRRVVLFGGYSAWNGNVLNAETWEWDGAAWTQLPISGPSPRVSPAMAYDSARDTSVLFGGSVGSLPYSGETWELHCSGSLLATQPFDQLSCPFGPAAFAVTTAGSATLTYQWQYQAGPASTVPIAWTNLVNGDNFVGPQFTLHATGVNTRLVVVDHDPTYWPDTTLDPVFKFRCVVTNACGSVTSDEATLSICAADFDCDGFLTGEDFDGYVVAFEAGDIAADFNHDGFVTGEDFDAFVAAFEAGC